MKSKFLLFDSDSEARLVEGNVKDGIADVDGKSFFVDESTPIFLKSTLGIKPLYIVKWSEMKPSMNFNPTFTPDNQEEQIIKSQNPKFPDKKKKKDITPELYRKLIGIKILGNMIKPKSNIELGGGPMLIIGMIITVIILYVIYIMGWIPAMG